MTGGAVRTVLASLLLAVVDTAAGQSFGAITMRGGELGADASGAYRLFATSRSINDATYRQWLRIPISGFLVDRRVLSYSLTLRPSFRQQSSTRMSEDVTSRNLGLDFGLNLLQTKKFSFTVAGARATGSSRGSFGADTEFRTSNFGASMFWRNRMFPATLSFARRSLRDEWFGAPGLLSPIRRNEAIETVRLSARSTKTSAYVERMVFDDRSNGLDFRSVDWSIDHAIKWGKGSSIDTRVGRLERNGYSPYDRFTWTERLHIQHTYGLSTEYQYNRQNWTNGVPARSRAGSVGVRYRPADWLAANAQASRQSFRYGSGGTDRNRVIPDISMQIEFPEGVRLTAGASLGWEELHRDLPEDTYLTVVDEQHTVDEGRSFTLINSHIDLQSIVLRNGEGTLAYLLDTDYQITVVGDLVQVFVVPSGRILEGDVLLVSYRYVGLSSGRFETWNLSYNAGLSWQGLTLRHGRTQRDETPLDAGGGLTQDVDMWTAVGISRRTPIGHFQLYGAQRNRTIRELDYVIHELRGSWSLPLGRIQLSVDGSANQTVSSVTRSRSQTGSARLSWVPSLALRLEGVVDTWRWRADASPVDRFYGGHLSLEWRFGRVQLSGRYDHNRRYVMNSSREHRWSVYALRRF